MNGYTVDMREVAQLFKQMSALSADMRKVASGQLRSAAADCANGLIPALQSAGNGAATPQARLVAQTARIKSDRLPAVQVGGPARVGHRGTQAGVLLWGSERGGRNFPPGPGGPYWIDPTVKRFEAGPATDLYRLAVLKIFQFHGIL